MIVFAEFHDAELGEPLQRQGSITIPLHDMHGFISTGMMMYQVWLFDAVLTVSQEGPQLPGDGPYGTISEIEGLPDIVEIEGAEPPFSRTICVANATITCSSGKRLEFVSAELVLSLIERKSFLESFKGPLWDENSRAQVLRLEDDSMQHRR